MIQGDAGPCAGHIHLILLGRVDGFDCLAVSSPPRTKISLHIDLAVMERLKFPSVRNADDGCCTEFLGQDFHHTILADGIQG